MRWRNSGPGRPTPLGWGSGKQGSGGCTRGHREEVCGSPPCSPNQDKRVLGLVRQAEVSLGGRTLGLTCLSVPSYAESSLIALAVCTRPFPRCALGSQSAVATEAGQSEGQGDRRCPGQEGTFRAGLGVGWEVPQASEVGLEERVRGKPGRRAGVEGLECRERAALGGSGLWSCRRPGLCPAGPRISGWDVV